MNNQQSVISFNNVSKKFRRGQKLLLKEALIDMFIPNKQEDFWALKNINFNIKKGETVGIIGNNGSGKSTLLKLIAGVMYPTEGTIKVSGRISPLIELGAGFHPELTGRENIYLNGAILGLSKKQVENRFQKIVAFSELFDFIDTPVKHYSSGMYMRLGFSVAVHTDPEILLIDEIFAVGDTSFQEKCFKKMEEFKMKNVTIVFVTHNMETVKKFCNKAIYINKGSTEKIGNAKQIVDEYLH
jgi:ABC-type polysaccharide/polyol phosphate transport system ATPase subunit